MGSLNTDGSQIQQSREAFRNLGKAYIRSKDRLELETIVETGVFYDSQIHSAKSVVLIDSVAKVTNQEEDSVSDRNFQGDTITPVNGTAPIALGAVGLGSLSGVSVSGADDGDVLVYSSGTQTWGPQENSLNNLTDVDTSGVTDGQVLSYDSATQTWQPGTPASGVSALNDLSDVDDSAKQNGYALVYNSSNQTWEAQQQTDTNTDSWPTLTVLSLNADGNSLSLSDTGKLVVMQAGATLSSNTDLPNNPSAGTHYLLKNLSSSTWIIDSIVGTEIDGATDRFWDIDPSGHYAHVASYDGSTYIMLERTSGVHF